MPNKDFIPKDKMARDYWIYNFVAKVEAHPTHYWMTPAQFADLKALAKSAHADYDTYLKTQIDLKSRGAETQRRRAAL